MILYGCPATSTVSLSVLSLVRLPYDISGKLKYLCDSGAFTRFYAIVQSSVMLKLNCVYASITIQ